MVSKHQKWSQTLLFSGVVLIHSTRTQYSLASLPHAAVTKAIIFKCLEYGAAISSQGGTRVLRCGVIDCLIFT